MRVLLVLTVLVATAGLRVPTPSMMGRAENRKAAAKAAKAAKKKKAGGGAPSAVTPAAALGLTPAEYQARVDNPPAQTEPSAPMDDFAFVPKVMDDPNFVPKVMTPAEFQARVENPTVQAPAEPSAPMDDFAFVPKVMDGLNFVPKVMDDVVRQQEVVGAAEPAAEPAVEAAAEAERLRVQMEAAAEARDYREAARLQAALEEAEAAIATAAAAAAAAAATELDTGVMDDGGLMAEFQARVDNPPAQPPTELAAPPVRAPTERERSFLQDSPHNTGMALMAEGNYEFAGLEFEKALDLDNDALDSWSALGVCMSELAQPEAALVCQRQVQRLQALEGQREAQSEAELLELASEAAALPTLPDGKQLALASGRLAECDTGGTFWSCAPVLCRWLKREAAGVCASSVLELGCGTGAVGLYAAALGARRVVMTDGGPPAVLELARANEAANRQMWRAAQQVEVRPLAWGEAPAATEGEGEGGSDVLGGAYDWVLGSDVTYSQGAHAPLCATIADVLSRAGAAGRATRAVLAHEHRVSDDAAADVRLEHFQEAAATAGLSVAVLESEFEGERRVSVLQLSLTQ